MARGVPVRTACKVIPSRAAVQRRARFCLDRRATATFSPSPRSHEREENAPDEAGERAFSSRMGPDKPAMARPGATPRTPTAPHSLNATPPQTWEDQVTVSDRLRSCPTDSMNE